MPDVICTDTEFGTDEATGELYLRTGCGLEKNDAGEVAVTARTADQYEDDYGCDVSNGEPLYCDDNGVLRTAPPHGSINGFVGGAAYTGPNTLVPGDFADPNAGPGNGSTQWSTTATLELTNPSDCRCLMLHLQFGIAAGMQVRDGAYGELWYARDLGAGTLTARPIEGQGILTPDAPRQAFAYNLERDFTGVVAPGETFTVRLRVGAYAPGGVQGVNIAAEHPNAEFTVHSLSGTIRYWANTMDERVIAADSDVQLQCPEDGFNFTSFGSDAQGN